MEEIYKKHTQCRVCTSKKLVKYLDLGLIPLANNLENTAEEAINAPRYPLEVMLCMDCGLSQLSGVVSPEKLYSHYTYRSGINQGYIDHCKEMCEILTKKYNLNENTIHIDIAGNDGTLLKTFKQELNHVCINIDPAENLTKDSNIFCINDFWSKDLVESPINSNFLKSKVDLITATNVIAHVNNIKDFLQGVKIALKPEGICVIECPYIVDHIDKMEWTQVYFEHLSYMSVGPVYILAKQVGLKIINVERLDIHGGSIRMTLSHEESSLESDGSPEKLFDFEMDAHYDNIHRCKEWAEKVKKSIDNLSMEIGILKLKKYKIAAFAASAKGNTLLNSALLSCEIIDYIVDETPEKQNKYTPGTCIPIIGLDELVLNPPDYLLILSWNFKDEIIEKCRKIGYKGKFIVPIPEFQIID